MPDFMRKTRRPFGKVADEHEEMRAALFVRPRKDDGTTRMIGTPGALAGKADEAETGERTADDVPQMNLVLALSDRRLLAFRHGSLFGRVHSLQFEVDLHDIDDITFDDRNGRILAISFRDGSYVTVTPGSRVQRFLKAWTLARAGVR